MNTVPGRFSLLPASHSPDHNHLLAALPLEIFKRISPHLELISMPLGDVLYESGGKQQHVYFPTSAIVSLHYIMENGSSLEIAGVGSEGVLDISFFMGGDRTLNRAAVNTGGYGYRLRPGLLMEEFNRVGGRRAGVMQHLMMRYTQVLMSQMSQTAICNRHHSVEQQLCRCLLMTLDRMPTNELTITQELIASMLGVRREGITETAGNLQRAGLISYHRGHITVLDRPGLESRACECYDVVRKEFRRLFSDIHKHQKIALACYA
ncbi:MAG: Crp/Fnr family transcriptional regulator [Proteobacteria bacterium]|nr:Crp/Fnr family transcriptional regulator [Pseudomonadota bacterium]